MLPFTPAEFFDVFGSYNHAVWPLQIVAYGLGLVALGSLFWPSQAGDRVISAILAAMWLWNGIAYHWVFFSAINPLAFFFGAAFVIQGLIYLFEGVLRRRLNFGIARDLRSFVGIAFLIYATVLYPIIGYLLEHSYPRTPTFGITPCPLAIFTFGFLLFLRGRTRWWQHAIAIAWSVVGGSAAFLLDVPQDLVLLIAGPVTVGLLYFAQPEVAAHSRRS